MNTNQDGTFWKKLILVLLPLFILGLVNAIIMYDSLKHMEAEVFEIKETKVNNEVLLQYIQLHKEIHDASEKGIDDNSDQIILLRKRLDDFITKYLSYHTRGKTQYIKSDDYYEYLCMIGAK